MSKQKNENTEYKEQSEHGVLLIVREYGESSYKFSENSITVVIPFDKIGFGKECGAVNDVSGAENTLSGAVNGAVNDVSGAENTLSDAENGAVNEVSGAENILSGAENGAVNDVSGAENLIEEEKIKKQILQLIEDNPSISRKDLALIIGKGTTTIYRVFKRLKKQGIIERIGSDKKGVWIIKK